MEGQSLSMILFCLCACMSIYICIYIFMQIGKINALNLLILHARNFSRLALELSFCMFLAREDNSKNTNKHFLGAPLITEDDSCSFFVYLAAMFCIHFDFSDCLLLAKLLIIKCGETLSDLG